MSHFRRGGECRGVVNVGGGECRILEGGGECRGVVNAGGGECRGGECRTII